MATWRAPKKTRITRSPPQPECQTRTEWAGILTDQHLWPGQPVLADLRFVQMTAFQSAETPPPVNFRTETVLSFADQPLATSRLKELFALSRFSSVDVIFRPAQHIRHGITDRSLWRGTASSAPAKWELTRAQPARRMGDGERCETYPRLAVSALAAGQRLSNPGSGIFYPTLLSRRPCSANPFPGPFPMVPCQPGCLSPNRRGGRSRCAIRSAGCLPGGVRTGWPLPL
jgi:hypothetical protein